MCHCADPVQVCDGAKEPRQRCDQSWLLCRRPDASKVRVRGSAIHNYGLLCSGGRDQVVHVWDLTTGATHKTIPVFEVKFTALNT